MAVIFDGKKFAHEKEKSLRRQFKLIVDKKKIAPKLVSILVGNNPTICLYTRLKKEAAERVGVNFEKVEFAEKAKDRQIKEYIKKLNKNPRVGGIMVQLPLPVSLKDKKGEIVETIVPTKDVDCLTPENLGLLMMGRPRVLPATVRGIWEILGRARINEKTIVGKNVCVLGRSDIVGKPLANLLINRGATVTVCHRRTKDLACLIKRADIIISATGSPNLVKGEMVKEGAIVIDVGSPKGDIDFDSVIKKASFITPVPGGVGPMTVISLLGNFLDLALLFLFFLIR